MALTELADALRRRASEIGESVAGQLGFDPDEYRHRLAFVDVVRHLLEVGVLHEVETSAVEWVRDPDAGEALYDVDRDVLHLLFVPPRVIQHVRSARALLTTSAAASRDTRRAEVRQRLVRLLLEHPVVYLDDLDDASRTYLVGQARSLGEDLERLTGAQFERRAEGVALIDATGGFSDRRFPTGGTAAQVALLLADAMADELAVAGSAGTEVATVAVPGADDQVVALAERLDAVRPVRSHELVDLDGPSVAGAATPVDPAAATVAGWEGAGPADRDAATGPLFTTDWLEERTFALSVAHGRTFAADLRDDPAALAGAAVEVLAAFDLVRPVAGGVVARPALARYRDPVVHVAVPPQPSLLDAADGPAAEADPAPGGDTPTDHEPDSGGSR